MPRTISAAPPVDAPSQQTVPQVLQNSGSRAALRRMLLFAGSAAMLLWVAVYNGYPTVTPDSGNYIRSGAFHIALFPYRAPGYAMFTRWTSLATSAWYIVAAQAVIVAYVLRETFVHLIGEDDADRGLLATVCALSLLTSLPWFVSQLMPDIFAGVLFLSLFLVGFADEFGLGRKIVLASIATLAIAMHTSLFPIALAYVAVIVVVKFFARQTRKAAPAWSAVLALLLVPIMLAGLWTATQNRKLGLGFKLSPSKNAFLLGRLFGDGLAPEFLRANCPARSFISCGYLSNLPRDDEDFLFYHPLLPALHGHDDEVDEIVRGTLHAYPGKFVLSGFKQTALQLVTLRTGGSMHIRPATDGNFYDLRFALPGDIPAYKTAGQLTGRLSPLIDTIALLHVALFWLSAAGCAIFLWTRRFARIDQFLLLAGAFLVINAAVCGAFAGVVDRYQSRVEWIVPLCVAIYLCGFLKERSSLSDTTRR